MKNQKHMLFSIVIILFFTMPAYSQIGATRGFGGSGQNEFGLKPNISYLNVFGSGDISTIGFGLEGTAAKSNEDNAYISLGFHYYTPHTYTEEASAFALSSTTSPDEIPIEVEYQNSFYHLRGNYHIFFVGDRKADYGVAGMAGIGIMVQPYSSTILTDFDKDEYSSSYKSEDDNLMNFTINVGVSGEKKIGNLYLFTDIMYTMPATRENDTTAEIELNSSFAMNGGIRIPF